jgi:hypothetical protein
MTPGTMGQRASAQSMQVAERALCEKAEEGDEHDCQAHIARGEIACVDMNSQPNRAGFRDRLKQIISYRHGYAPVAPVKVLEVDTGG